MVLKTYIVEYHCDYWNIDNQMELQASDLDSAKHLAKISLSNDRCHILKVYEKTSN